MRQVRARSFFFSSRRRHTRWNCDWSSDVCSSDLPFMLLVIESLGERGPNGHRALSIAHYGEQNGDAMRDPEICAEIVIENGAAKLWPYYFRNDYAGVERWNRQREADGSMTCRPRETRDLESFMEMWDANIHDQGFLA